MISQNEKTIDFTPESAPLRRSVWLIFLAATAVLLFFLGRNALLSNEGNFAEGIRQIVAQQDIFSADNWWVPTEKSSLWFCRGRSLAAEFFGISEFSCRLFSAAAAIVLLGGTMLLAQEFFNRQVMYCTAWLLIGSYGFIYWGRHISPFMTLAAWTVGATWILCIAKERFWWRMLAVFMLAAGVCWWGMYFIILLPGMMVISFDRWRRAVWHWNLSLAILAALAVLCVILLWQVGNSEVPKQEYFPRLAAQLKYSFMESWRSVAATEQLSRWYAFIINLPRLLLPWVIPSAALLAGMICKYKELFPEHKRLLIGALLMWLCSGIFPGCRWQYQLAQLPFFLILTAAGINGITGVEKWSQFADRLMKWIMSVLCSLLTCTICIWPLWEIVLQTPPPLAIMFCLPLLGLTGLALLIFDTGKSSDVERLSGMNGAWSGYILAGVCVTEALLSVAVPSLTRYRSGRPFWKFCGQAAYDLPSAEILFFGDRPNALAMYYMNLPQNCTVVGDRDILAQKLAAAAVPKLLLIVKKYDFPAVKECVEKNGWQMENEQLLAVESSKVNLSDTADFQYGDKFMLFRIIREKAY